MNSEVTYKKVYETIKKEILDGKYAEGKPFPSSVALSRRFGIPRFTIRQALDILVNEGLVRSHRGRGTFVTSLYASRKIGVIIPGVIVSEFFRAVASTVVRLARAGGYTVLFGETYSADAASRVKEARDLAAEMIRNRVAGILYQPFESHADDVDTNRRILSALDAKRIPVVLLDRDAVMPPERTAHDLVAINNVDACERLARHVVDAGAKRICFLTNCAYIPNVRSRLRGFLCAKAALESSRVRFEVMYGAADDMAFLRGKIKGRLPPDAIVCDSDTTAAILRQSLDKLGRRVPDDVMIAGFDDVRLASLMTPQLTTIHQPCEEIASQAFRRLMERIQNPSLPPTEILLDSPLVVRASTRRRPVQRKEAK